MMAGMGVYADVLASVTSLYLLVILVTAAAPPSPPTVLVEVLVCSVDRRCWSSLTTASVPQSWLSR